jgi:pimeloyl-ACP methyl ester carboxylesterase
MAARRGLRDGQLRTAPRTSRRSPTRLAPTASTSRATRAAVPTRLHVRPCWRTACELPRLSRARPPRTLRGSRWAGNAEENLEEFRAAGVGGEALRRLLETWRDEMLEPTGNDIEESLASLGSLVSATDPAVVMQELSMFQAARRRHSISDRIWGWFDDDLSEMKPWGFEIDSIRVPVSIWHGEDDKFVPRSHAEWLMASVPGATRHMLAGEGHWSIKERRLDVSPRCSGSPSTSRNTVRCRREPPGRKVAA